MLSKVFSVQILYNHVYEEGLSRTRRSRVIRKEGREEAWVVMVKRLLLTPHSTRKKAETLLWEPTFPTQRFHRHTCPSDSGSQLSSCLHIRYRRFTEEGPPSGEWGREIQGIKPGGSESCFFTTMSVLWNNANCKRFVFFTWLYYKTF